MSSMRNSFKRPMGELFNMIFISVSPYLSKNWGAHLEPRVPFLCSCTCTGDPLMSCQPGTQERCCMGSILGFRFTFSVFCSLLLLEEFVSLCSPLQIIMGQEG